MAGNALDAVGDLAGAVAEAAGDLAGDVGETAGYAGIAAIEAAKDAVDAAGVFDEDAEEDAEDDADDVDMYAGAGPMDLDDGGPTGGGAAPKVRYSMDPPARKTYP